MTDYLHRDPTRRRRAVDYRAGRRPDPHAGGDVALLAGARQRAVRVHHWAAAALLAPGRPGLARRAARSPPGAVSPEFSTTSAFGRARSRRSCYGESMSKQPKPRQRRNQRWPRRGPLAQARQGRERHHNRCAVTRLPARCGVGGHGTSTTPGASTPVPSTGRSMPRRARRAGRLLLRGDHVAPKDAKRRSGSGATKWLAGYERGVGRPCAKLRSTSRSPAHTLMRVSMSPPCRRRAFPTATAPRTRARRPYVYAPTPPASEVVQRRGPRRDQGTVLATHVARTTAAVVR